MTLISLWFTTLAVCIVGAIIPFVNTEIYLLSVSALSPPEFVLPLVVAASVGQMAGKIAMYYAGRGIPRMKNEKVRLRVAIVREKMEKRPLVAKLTLFSSAVFGLPPLYIVSIVCGTIGMGMGSFLSIGLAGRLIHFAVVAMLPQYAKILMG